MKIGKHGKSSPDELKGKPRPKPGKYHAAILHVNETFEKQDAVIVEFEIIKGTTPGQEGKTISAFYNMKKQDDSDNSDNVQRIMSRLAWVCGAEIPQDEAEFDLHELLNGRQLVIEVEDGVSKAGKAFTSIANYGEAFWSLDDEAVKDVPKNQAALKLIGQKESAGSKPANGNGQKQHATAGAPANGTNESEWKDLMP